MIFIHDLKFILVLMFVLVTQQSVASSHQSSEILYFMGFKNNQWMIFYKNFQDVNFQSIKTESEPRELYFSPQENIVYYIDADTNLRQLTLSEKQQEKVLFKPSENDLYAQPYWDKENKLLYLVKMPHGKSSEADIVVWEKGKMNPVIQQISSQFEPFISHENWLYYGHVHCSLDCGRIIQEIWRKNLITGESEQLIMLGSISRQAIVDSKEEWVYFSSNKQGSYHIWRQALPDSTHSKIDGAVIAEQVSKGDVTDTDPAISLQGDLFFIRHKEAKASLMHLDKNGNLKPIPLPEGISEIRNLRINS